MTIKDLAARTGYAVGTVSRALNNHPNVSPKAREVILKEAQICGFELNVNAKQLKQLVTTTILVVVKGRGNELFGEMVETIQNELARTHYHLAVDYMDEDSNEVLRALALRREKKPRGILFLGGNSDNFIRDFEKIEAPCVLVTNDASGLSFPNLSSVCTDDREAGKAAINALISLGHRQIAVVGGDRAVSDTGRLRFEGCMQAFAQHGVAFDPNEDYQGVRFSYKDGYEAVCELLKNQKKYTAIFAMADVMAIGAIRALRDNGLRVPEDVSVMGLDGLPLSSYLTPQLATISQSAQAMARRGVEILLKGIEHGAPACHELVPFGVLLRESVRNI